MSMPKGGDIEMNALITFAKHYMNGRRAGYVETANDSRIAEQLIERLSSLDQPPCIAELEAQKAAPATMAVPEGWQDIISDVVSNIGEASNDLRTQDQALYVSGQLDRLLMLLNPLSTQPQAAQAVPEGYTLVLTSEVLWLLGENGDFECPGDMYFRDKPRPYFWRNRLRKAMLAASQPKEAK